jgi:hypothetical protein
MDVEAQLSGQQLVGLSVRKGAHSLLGSQRETRAKLNPGNAFR